MKAQNNSRQVLVLSVVEVLDNEKDEEKKNKSENRGNAGIVVEMPTGEKWVADFHILIWKLHNRLERLCSAEPSPLNHPEVKKKTTFI